MHRGAESEGCEYQGSAGQTACDACLAGSYCTEGASAPTPCPGGTWSDETGLEGETGSTAERSRVGPREITSPELEPKLSVRLGTRSSVKCLCWIMVMLT